MLKPRENVINWTDYFMSMAILTSMRSKDPNSQVGAVLVNDKNRIISLGYNGFPQGVDNYSLPWDRDGEFLNTKYPYVVHAEQNAVHNANMQDLSNCTLYCTLYPCVECGKIIIQKGIKNIIYLSDKYYHTDFSKAATKLFLMTGTICIKYTGHLQISMDLSSGLYTIKETIKEQ